MSEWEPATDAEAAMRDALRTDDQESYFRILAGIDLLLPVSADALAGLAPLGWGTWSTGGRTHVLAFTSPAALQACLADYTGSARRVAYGELADTWPNLEWWLAVNPGLPIEGYLPAWFVAQLSRGDLRLPTRGPARDGIRSAQNPRDLQAAARAANAAAAGEPGGASGPVTRQSSGDPHATGGPVSPAGASRAGATAYQPGGDHGPGRPGAQEPAAQNPAASSGDHGRAPEAGDYGPGGSTAVSGGHGPEAVRSGVPGTPGGGDAGRPGPGQVGPGGLPIRTPGAVLPSGLPSRVPASSLPGDSSDYRGFSGFTTPGGAGEAGASGGGPVDPAPEASGIQLPASGAQPPGRAGPATPSSQDPRSPLPVRTPMAQTPPLPSHLAGENPAARPDSGAEGHAGATRVDPAAFRGGGDGADAGTQGRAGATRVDPAIFRENPDRTDKEAEGSGDRQDGDGSAAIGSDQPGALPRRQATPPSERPASMVAAAQAPAGGRTAQTETASPSPTRPSLAPPVIPGAGGSERPPFVPPASVRPGVPSEADAPPGTTPAPARDEQFEPANAVERDLFDAADDGSTDAFLSTLLLATVLVPVGDSSRPGSTPGEPGFAFRTEDLDGEQFLVVFTSRDRLAEHYAEPTRTVGVKFLDLIRHWPDPKWSFAVNPSTPVGAKYPGAQVIALANWAAEAGLGAEPEERDDKPAPLPKPVSDAAQHATVMQKTVPAEQVDYYLERGYDRVAGFVHRANEVEHLRTPAELFAALGLVHEGTPHQPDAKEAFVLRWPAYRPSLYRIPYGGQSEQALRAMDGWVIERPPFRGNGFAPGEGRDVIAEFKVDSVRLPHGAQLWRMDADGTEKMIAIFDGDAPAWRKVGEQ